MPKKVYVLIWKIYTTNGTNNAPIPNDPVWIINQKDVYYFFIVFKKQATKLIYNTQNAKALINTIIFWIINVNTFENKTLKKAIVPNANIINRFKFDFGYLFLK